MNDNEFLRKTWMGGGLKGGGQIIGGGYETTEGAIFNLAHPAWWFEYEIENFRLGPGLGGGAGLVAVIAFNVININTLSGTSISDWGFNFSIGAKWDKVMKAVGEWRKYQLLIELAKNATKAEEAGKNLEGLKQLASTLWNGFDMSKNENKPAIFALDLPAGTGVEVSLVATYGTFRINR